MVPPIDAPVTHAEMVACVERELGYRQKVYPRWVSAGKMRASKAAVELARMIAVLAYLKGERVQG